MKHSRLHPISLMPRADLEVIVLNDPASTGPLPVLLNFKGYVALQTWRVSNWLWRQNRRDLALFVAKRVIRSFQISIHPSASIGTSVFLDHGTGLVVGSFATIGDKVTIQQNVTVGRKAESPNRAPRIGRGVLLSTGATILGDVSIGDFAKIGAGAVVTSDVPSGSTAVGVPARLTNCPDEVPA
jgi:serine O-acetyltransferase